MAWDNVTQDTIANCWRHTGILLNTLPASIPERIDYGNLFERMALVLNIPAENLMTVDDFTLVDVSQV